MNERSNLIAKLETCGPALAARPLLPDSLLPALPHALASHLDVCMVGGMELLPHRVRTLALTAIGIVLFGVDDPGAPSNQVEIHLELDLSTQLASVWQVMSRVPPAPLPGELSLLGPPGALSFPQQGGAAQPPLLCGEVGIEQEKHVGDGWCGRPLPTLSTQTGHLLFQLPRVFQPLGKWPGHFQDHAARGKGHLGQGDSEQFHPKTFQTVGWVMIRLQLWLVENLNREWDIRGKSHRAGQLQPELSPLQVLFLV